MWYLYSISLSSEKRLIELLKKNKIKYMNKGFYETEYELTIKLAIKHSKKNKDRLLKIIEEVQNEETNISN